MLRSNILATFLMLLFSNIAKCDEAKINELNLKCLESVNHKLKPEKESELTGICGQWKDLSCCNKSTADIIHETETSLIKFNYDHCFELSKECKQKFIQELCLYECDPYLGQFMVSDTSRKFRNQRYYKIPICKRDCESWFDACKYDYTCRDNWKKGFKWQDGLNTCYEQDKCRTFKEVFSNAKNFCSSVWDESFEMTESDNCFSFDFEGQNPNEKAARFYLP